MADFKNYDPGLVVVSFRGARLTGYSEGSFVKGSRNEDAFTEAVGAGGDVVRVRNRNRSGEVTVTLQQSAPSNAVLSAMAETDELTGLAYGPLQVVDLLGNDLLIAENAWIKKVPEVGFDKSQTDREWVFGCAELSVFAGGSVA